MRTFTLDSDDNITGFTSAEEADLQPGVERFHSAEQLAALAKTWSGGRLVKIWNKLAGVHSVNKFTNRQTGVTRIWKALQSPAGAASRDAPVTKPLGTLPRVTFPRAFAELPGRVRPQSLS